MIIYSALLSLNSFEQFIIGKRMNDNAHKFCEVSVKYSDLFPMISCYFSIRVIKMKEYEAYKQKTGMTLIALQPNVPDDAYMSHMKGIHVPFNMAYGSLIYH